MKFKFFLIAIILLLTLALHAADADTNKAERVAQKAAKILGWSEATVTPKDVPGKAYLISSDGKGDNSDIRGYATELGSPLDIAYNFQIIDMFGLDMEKSNYQGRDARVIRAGKNCNPTGISKMLNDMVNGWFEDIFGPSDDPDKGCIIQHGTYLWACKNYMFMATDETKDGGHEGDVAAAFYSAAQEEGLCDFGDTLVIPAASGDKPGGKNIAEFQKIAQRVNDYYAKNSYGKEKFTFSFMDADGSKGHNDWYDVAPSQAGFSQQAYVEAAVKKAFSGTSVPQDLNFKRIIVVYSGDSKQADPARGIFSTADQWEDSNYAIEVPAVGRTAKISSTDLIIVAENDEMGLWAHEIGHSMYSKYPMFSTYYHVADRYNYAGDATGQHGTVGSWDLMGSGNWWGTPLAANPVQMSSFTKESAQWLSYGDIQMNTTYTATAIENKKLGDTVYRFHNPQSNDDRSYYLIEARDASGLYSAPETGTVIYKVSYDSRNSHYIVNSIGPQTGITSRNDSPNYKYSYARSTLHGAEAFNGATIYRNVPGKFKITLEKESASPYTATFKIDPYETRNLIGATLNPSHPQVQPIGGIAITSGTLGPLPDLDLHAYDDKGGHVGMNYASGQYENTIPGAIASGDLKDDQEWIYVPEGTKVRFEVSSYKTKQFIDANPSLASKVKPQEFQTSLMKVDSQGVITEADGGNATISAGSTSNVKSPNDPGLKYGPMQMEPGPLSSMIICGAVGIVLLLAGAGIAAYFYLKGKKPNSKPEQKPEAKPDSKPEAKHDSAHGKPDSKPESKHGKKSD